MHRGDMFTFIKYMCPLNHAHTKIATLCWMQFSPRYFINHALYSYYIWTWHEFYKRVVFCILKKLLQILDLWKGKKNLFVNSCLIFIRRFPISDISQGICVPLRNKGICRLAVLGGKLKTGWRGELCKVCHWCSAIS